jgi:phosphatidylserine/phosphatidylglycerophosphate/cardiolipin synthase-like enzyme
LWRDVIQSERSVIDFSGGNFTEPNFSDKQIFETASSSLMVKLVTEESIKKAILDEFELLQSGDGLDMAMFYISDRDIVKAIKKADERGVKIRLLFDPNKDAFGREKDGVPNRQVASEILDGSKNVEVRWCLTHGEQCHFKFVLFKKYKTPVFSLSKLNNIRKSNQFSLIQGSANLTRRNLGNYNLETNVLVSGDKNEKFFIESESFFDEIWNNENRKIYSTQYKEYQDDRLIKKIQYLLMEYSGLSSF